MLFERGGRRIEMPGPHGLQGALILFLVCIRAGGWLLPGLRTREGEATDAGSYEVTPGKLVGSGGDRRIVSRPAPPCTPTTPCRRQLRVCACPDDPNPDRTSCPGGRAGRRFSVSGTAAARASSMEWPPWR